MPAIRACLESPDTIACSSPPSRNATTTSHSGERIVVAAAPPPTPRLASIRTRFGALGTWCTVRFVRPGGADLMRGLQDPSCKPQSPKRAVEFERQRSPPTWGSARAAQGLVRGPSDPEAMEQRGQLAGDAHHRALLPVLPPRGPPVGAPSAARYSRAHAGGHGERRQRSCCYQY